MQIICTSLQTDNYPSTSSVNFWVIARQWPNWRWPNRFTEVKCVRPSVRTSTKSFSDLNVIWCVGRPRPDVRTSMTSTQSKVKVMELLKFRKLQFPRSICSAILARSSKLVVDDDSTGPSLQLFRVRFSHFLLRKPSCEFKLRGMLILHKLLMAMFPYCLTLWSHSQASW